MNENSSRVREIALIAVMAAFICVVSPFTIPIGPIPISVCNLMICFAVGILGMKKGTMSVIVYLLIGAVGVPVFSGFSGGFGKVLGPTGGYIIGYIFLALIAGFFVQRFPKSMILCFAGMIIGTAVLYAFGTAWLAYQAHMTAGAALAAGVLPFIPFDVVKIIIASILAPQIRRRLEVAGILD